MTGEAEPRPAISLSYLLGDVLDNQELLVNRVSRQYVKFLKILALVAMVAVGLMSLSTTLDVLKRWSTGWPFGGIMQLNECLMVVLVFLGIPLAQFHRRHIRIAFVVSRMRPRNVVITDVASCLIAFICLAMLGVMTAKEAAYSFSILEYRVGDVRLPIYWARALIPLGCFAFMGQLIIDIWTNIEKLRGRLPMEVEDIRSIQEH